MKKVLICAVCLGSAGLLFGAEQNLLVNPELSWSGGNVPGWTFAAGDAVTKVEHGAAEDPKVGKYLFIKIPAGVEASSWWFQELPAQPHATYILSFKGRGFSSDDKRDRVMRVAVWFRSQAGEWIDDRNLVSLGEQQAKWPGATKPDTLDWTDFTVTFTAPAGAAKLGVRLACSGTSVETGYAGVKLSLPEKTVPEVLNRTPASLPQFTASMAPASAEGVTFTPDWSLDDAAQWSSATRRKICLNGLWALQPSTIDGAVAQPGPEGWAFMKVPGRFREEPAGGRSFFYGQDKTVWAKQDVNQVIPAFWLWRDMTLPEHEGRFIIDVSQMTGLSGRAYWNGKPIGLLDGGWGTKLELPPEAKPGEKGQLAIFALSTSQSNCPEHVFASGQVARPFDNKTPRWAEVGDVYLLGEPKKPNFGEIRISPSVRKKELSVTLDRADAPAGTSWRLNVVEAGAGGTKALDLPATATPDGARLRLTVPWTTPRLWSPDDPFLYNLRVVLVDKAGRIVDESLPQRFGFREVWVDGKQLMMNGQVLRLRPRLSGAIAVDNASARRYFTFVRNMGFNCMIRPPAGGDRLFHDSLYDLADEVGYMMVPYTPYGEVSGGQFGSENTVAVDETLMKYVDSGLMSRTVNHPSVVAYSGFGPGLTMGGNNGYAHNPDWFGIKPLDTPRKIDDLAKESLLNDTTVSSLKRSIDFVKAIKGLVPDRPFLSHYDNGAGDGWSTFDYFNWTPLQEWETWIEPWSRKGVKPIGTWEHGLPYPMSFMNHGVPDGDSEPWVSEYAAARLGADSYALESEDYRKLMRDSYAKHKPAFSTAHNWLMDPSTDPAGQAVWAENNRNIYRAWRTYGVPMGMDPFGPSDNYIRGDSHTQGNRIVVADPKVPLKTPGLKPDTWNLQGYWPNYESSIAHEPFTTDNLTPLGKALYESNRPLLAYIAGGKPDFATKDHVFRAGEKVSKQIAVVWDGFHSTKLKLLVTAELDGKSCFTQEMKVESSGGEIKLLPFEFVAPKIEQARGSGRISLVVKDEKTGDLLAQDAFAFQVYNPDPALPALKLALFDPAGESAVMFDKLGVKTIKLDTLDQLRDHPVDLLVIGRRAVPSLRNLDLNKLVPRGLSVLVLEQTDQDLETAGFRSFPTRTRRTFALPAKHPVLANIETEELSDWRVRPTLYPATTAPLREGYNFRGDAYGTVASAVIEIPTSGPFTPLIQCEFDLAMTPLLAARMEGRRWVFSQLSLPDGVGKDPVADRITRNLLTWLATPEKAQAPKATAVLGSDADVQLARSLGLNPASTNALPPQPADALVVVGETPPDAQALKKWVSEGGTAMVLPLKSASEYSALSPELKVRADQTALAAFEPGNSTLLAGLGQNDFHYRQILPVYFFNGDSIVAETADGKGKWIWVGFDPRQLDLKTEPYLRLTYRRQCRVLSQLLHNSGASMQASADFLAGRMRSPLFAFDIAGNATNVRLRQQPSTTDKDWIAPGFDDKAWSAFNLATKQTPHGDANLRITFKLPAEIPPGGLVLDAGSMDDFDECYINGSLVGSVNPGNHDPESAWSKRRIYPVPSELLKPGRENILAIRAWNRKSPTNPALVRGPISIHTAEDAGADPYVGDYKHSDDPYLQRHW